MTGVIRSLGQPNGSFHLADLGKGSADYRVTTGSARRLPSITELLCTKIRGIARRAVSPKINWLMSGN